jgi:putative FmdB family regulatory protein
MPFYEYQCSACKHHTEVLQKISDAPLKKCPNCGKQTLQRLISAPVFRLKGGGWYETDFKSDSETKRNIAGREEGEPKAEGTKTDTAAKDGATAEKKSDSPPAETKSATVKTSSGTSKSARAKPAAKKAKPAARKKAGRR